MSANVAIIYYCEGTGHAMRTFAIAQRLKKRGLNVRMTGGGPGEKYVQLNDMSMFSPTVIKPGTRRQNTNLIMALLYLPSNLSKRLFDLKQWMDKKKTDILLTDDPVAGLLASFTGQKFYFINHWDWKIPENKLLKINTFIVNNILSIRSVKIFSPTLWEQNSEKFTTVGPLAPQSDCDAPDIEILVVPTAIKDITNELVDELESQGYSVLKVGSDNWEPKASLQSYIEKADFVICSGYSTVMEAAVAGTPVIIAPHTSEQRGIANILHNKKGFKKYSGDVINDIQNITIPKEYPNGAIRITDEIMNEL